MKPSGPGDYFMGVSFQVGFLWDESHTLSGLQLGTPSLETSV